MHRSRALGSLFGLAVGDALGTTNEFKEMRAPPFPALAEGPVDDVIGGGPFSLPAGGVTDDTQMAAALAVDIARAGTVDADAIARRYLAWMQVAFDIGIQIGQALDLVAAGVPASQSGRRIWEERQRFPAGNGALMRTGVIGVLLPSPAAARRDATFADAAITHFDPKCQLACAAYNASIAHAVLADAAPSPRDLVTAAEAELAPAAEALHARHADLRAEIAAAEAALRIDLVAARADDPDLYGNDVNLQRHAGFVRVAFRLAYWHLLHAPTFTAALIDVANRGGDADTNAAITGALWGAYAGVDAIPHAWIERVSRAPGLPLAGFHPRDLIASIDSSIRE